MRPITEKKVERYLIEAVKRMGGQSFKWTSPQHRGVPDRINFFPGGLVVLVEVKRPGGKLTPLQAKLKRTFDSLEIPYMVVDCYKAVDDFRDNIAMALDTIKEDDNGQQ